MYYILEVPRHKHCLYWNLFSTDINGKIIFNCLLLFKPFLLVSKLCESVVSVNSTIFFWHAETEPICIFKRFRYCNLWKFQFQLFFSNCSSHILVPFCWSVNCTSWTFDLNMNIYLRALSVAILQKFDLYYLCQFRFFSGLQIVQFWSVNYASYLRPS